MADVCLSYSPSSQPGPAMMGSLDAPKPIPSPFSWPLVFWSLSPPFLLSFLRFPTFQVRYSFPYSATFLPNFLHVSALFSFCFGSVKGCILHHCMGIGGPRRRPVFGGNFSRTLWPSWLTDYAYLLLLRQFLVFSFLPTFAIM